MERGRQQNDSLADGYGRPPKSDHHDRHSCGRLRLAAAGLEAAADAADDT